MPIVEVYKCPRSAKYFALKDKKKYITYLKKKARINMDSRKRKKYMTTGKAIIAEAQATLDNIPAIEKWLSENYDLLYTLYGYRESDFSHVVVECLVLYHSGEAYFPKFQIRKSLSTVCFCYMLYVY